MTLRIKDKVCLITGAGSGIGKAIAYRFAQEGAKLVLTDINSEALQDISADLAEKFQVGVMYLEQDVTCEKTWQVVIEETLSRFAKLDVLINNAGIVIPGNVEELSLQDWRKTHEVNNEGTFLGCKAAIGEMKKQGGSIINISSIEGIVGESQTSAYNSSKGGVRIFTKSTALHCAEQNYGIRVNSIHPGFIQTPLVENALASLSDSEAQAFLAKTIASIPLGKLGMPEDIANGCLFLASDESRYMTGSELVMDGGYTCH